MTLYRVRDWDKHFENNRSRTVDRLRWVAVPNKHDGDGYTTLMDHPAGPAHLGAWLVLVQVASKCHPRGTLVRANGRPYTPADLERTTRMPRSIIAAAIARLASEEIGWLEVVETSPARHTPDRQVSNEGMEGRKEKKRSNDGSISSLYQPKVKGIFRAAITAWGRDDLVVRDALKAGPALRLPPVEWLARLCSARDRRAGKLVAYARTVDNPHPDCYAEAKRLLEPCMASDAAAGLLEEAG